jgi:hypothetical protein
MTVSQSGTVDWLGLEKETGHVVLTNVDDLDWADEPAHLLTLQEKLHIYLAFIESGEVFERLEASVRGVARDTPVKVSILSKYAATPRAEAFLEQASTAFAGAGLSLVHKVLST